MTEKMSCFFISGMLLFISAIPTFSQGKFKFEENFNDGSGSFEKVGLGITHIKDGKLKTKNAYAIFGNKEWKNYEFRFSAKSPQSAESTQIWCGFRSSNRYDRYVLGLKGGNQNDIYLMRTGYLGADEILAIQPLDFQVNKDKWYDFKIEVCQNRIRIFLNNEKYPRIDIVDANAHLAASGGIALGGGWIETEYDNLKVISLSDDYFKNVELEEIDLTPSKREKEKQRLHERASYKPINISSNNQLRQVVSLNGQWLFMPSYEMTDEATAIDPSGEDKDWHSIPVPNYWNPSRIWLHGETYSSRRVSKGSSDTHFQKEIDRCKSYSFDYTKISFAWYRQWILLEEDFTDKNLDLVFEGVSKVAEVWINGKKAGSHVGMFGEFKINGNGLLKKGKNLIVLKAIKDFVDEIKDGDKIVDVAVSVEVTNNMLKDLAHGFYRENPSGIWQPVYLQITNKVSIRDVYIKPALDGAEFEVTVGNSGTKEVQFSISSLIKDSKDGSILYQKDNVLKNICLKPNESKIFTYKVENLRPQLWSPQSPHLYDFAFSINDKKHRLDESVITSGFRTFEMREGYFYLNNHKYWLRGANHTPYSLAPNDSVLADVFHQIMKTGNVDVTRTHTIPYNMLWMRSADKVGVGVSFEGTWPWLMIQSSMPDQKLIDYWADEFLGLVKKYRNNPSLLFWTVNNEMKFADNDPDTDRARRKMKIISDVVKRMREIDPSRPICFDSSYRRNEKKYGKSFFEHIDDGDIDDIHAYYNWYNPSLFYQFNGEFQKRHKNEGRALISQEMSTGYPNNETGHSTHFYTLVHQNPASLIGQLGYDFADPSYFLDTHAFITKELGEALRRSNEKAAGILHFALINWFRNVYDSQKIEPYPTFKQMKYALSPVLVSAELWGRHFYSGESIPTRICIVNDKENGEPLVNTVLNWTLVDASEQVLASGREKVDEVAHYGRKWITPNIGIPALSTGTKVKAKLRLSLNKNEEVISENVYDLLLADKQWATELNPKKKILLLDHNDTKAAFDFLNIQYRLVKNLAEMQQSRADVFVISGVDSTQMSKQEFSQLKSFVNGERKVILLNSEGVANKLFPNHINGFIKASDGDIVNTEIPESKLFDGIDPMELRYFNNNKREIPQVCKTALQINRTPQVTPLVSHIKIHAYVQGDMQKRCEYMNTISGFPIVKIEDKGTVLLSTILTNKASTDPVAGRLLVNMLTYVLEN